MDNLFILGIVLLSAIIGIIVGLIDRYRLFKKPHLPLFVNKIDDDEIPIRDAIKNLILTNSYADELEMDLYRVED